jgi:hypothetical protein
MWRLHEWLLVAWLAWPLEWAWGLSVLDGHLMRDWMPRSRLSSITISREELAMKFIPFERTKNSPPWRIISPDAKPVPDQKTEDIPAVMLEKKKITKKQMEQITEVRLLRDIQRTLPPGLQ